MINESRDNSVSNDQNATSSTNDGNFTRLVFCIYLPVAGLIIFSNGLIIAAFIKSPFLRSSTHRYLTSMAIGDITYGLSRILWLATLFPSAVAHNQLFCVSSASLLIVTRNLSLSHILVVLINRTTAIVLPFKHPNLCGHRNITIIITLIWLTSFLSGIPGFYALWNSWSSSSTGRQLEPPKSYLLIDISVRLALVCLIIVTSLVLLLESLKVAKRIDTETKILDCIAMRVRMSDNQDLACTPPIIRENESAQRRITRSLLAIVAAFVFCNLAPLITELLSLLVPSFSAQFPLLVFFNVGPSITAIINPWVFTLRDSNMYAVVISMLVCQPPENTT